MRIIRRPPPNGSHPALTSRRSHLTFSCRNSVFYPLFFAPVLCSSRESAAFASVWTSITCPIFPSNFLFGFSDFPLKIEYLKNPFFATFLIEKWPIWAVSSAGRARRSHRRGRGFDPLTVHQNWKSPQFSLRRFSRLTTEIPQTDFCFDHLKGTPFRKECPSFVYCGVNSAYYFSLSNAFLIFVM